MSFIRDVVEDSMGIWNECLRHPFLLELHQGTLPEEKFTRYIVQDSIYLREYARVFGMGILRSETYRDIRMFYGQLGFVTDHESAARVRYLSEHGISEDEADRIPALPACRNYTSFMLGEAAIGGVPEIMMATLPCTLSYFYLFEKLGEQYPQVQDSPFWYVVSEYTGEGYRAVCEKLGHYTEELCRDLPAARKERLREIFRTASAHELVFWDMAYGK